MASGKSIRNIVSNRVIRYFRADREEVMANEPILLEWEVDHARKIRLDGVEQSGNSHKTFINSPHDFRLSAYGLYGKSTAYRLISLYKPVILLLEADVIQVTEGAPVSFTLRFRYGQNWKLTVEYSGRLNGETEVLGTGTIMDGYVIAEQKVRVMLKDMGTVRLQVRNGSEMAIETTRLGKRALGVRLELDRDKAVPGASVRVTWEAAYAKELWLNPGHIDLTGLSYYDMVINGDHDVQLEIVANGDFGDQARDSRTVLLARISSFASSNNGDLLNPEFYLNWFTMRFWQLRLLPDNLPVSDVEDRYRILPSGPESYTLVGITRQREEVSSTISLGHCHIGSFELDNGKAMIGTTAVLHWSVTGARSLQLRFANDPVPVDLAPTATQHPFQVFKERHSVTLVAWGDLNVMTLNIPIPWFTGPEIQMIRLPLLDLRLGVNWISSPPVKRMQLSGLIRTLRQQGGGGRYYHGLWRWLFLPLRPVFFAHKRPTLQLAKGISNLLKTINNGTKRSENTTR